MYTDTVHARPSRINLLLCATFKQFNKAIKKKTHSKKMFLTRASKVRKHSIESQESRARVVGGKNFGYVKQFLTQFLQSFTASLF